MARLCIRILNNDHPTDPALTPLRTQEGDVVCLVDDSHVFSHAELNNGHYRIIDVPGVPQEELLHLVQHEQDVDGKMTKRRTQSLDPVALKTGLLAGKTNTTKAELALVTKVKV